MRRFQALLILPVLFGLPCRAGDGWNELLRRWVEGGQARRPWTLRLEPGPRGELWWRRDDALVQLVEDEDLAIDNLDPAQARELREARGWTGAPGWILLGRGGEVAGEGAGSPGGEAIRAAACSGGYRTGRELREAFLAAHPGQGEALEAKLFTGLGLMRARFLELAAQGKATAPRPGAAPEDPALSPGRLFPGRPAPGAATTTRLVRSGRSARGTRSAPAAPPPPSDPPEDVGAVPLDGQGPLADAIYLEAGDSLEQLIQLPDWWRMPRLAAFCANLEVWDAGASPRMRALFAGMRTAVLQEWQRNPHYGGDDLARLWSQLERCVEGEGTPVLPPLDPSPGRILPSRESLVRMWQPLLAKGDWRGLLLGARLSFPLPEGSITPVRWREFTDRQAFVLQTQALAQARLGRWKDAGIALAEARRWAGYGWSAMVAELRRDLPQELPAAAAEVAFTLGLDPEPYREPPPPFQPVRMLLAGGRPWSGAWGRLRDQPGLAAWGASELLWRTASAQDEALLAAAGLGGPRWAAIQGDSNLLATGEALPDPAFLAGQLAAVGPTRLERLTTFIERNPDHLDARRDRFLLLRQRMPNPALEPQLADDAARAWIDPVTAQGMPWHPDPGLWEVRAAGLTQELERALERWPSDARLWKLWLAWSALLPQPPSAHDLAQTLPVYDPKGRWEASLPLEAHLAIARELRGEGRFEAMRSWFQAAWEPFLTGTVSRGEQEKVDRIGRFLGEALAALGLRDALAELNAQREGLRFARPKAAAPLR